MADDNKDDSESYEEATDAEKLAIAKHFVMHSPNGEVGDVVRDMRTLLNKELVTDEWEKTVLTKYNKSQFVQVGTGDNMFVQSKYSMIDGGKFINPNSSKAATIDPKTQKVGDVEDVKLDDENEEVRAATQKAMNAYLKKHYTNDNSHKSGCAQVYANGGSLNIVVTMKNMNLANFWSGGWRSEYTVAVGAEGAADLNGRIRVNVHYFEDGNVQLNTDFPIKQPPSVKVSGDAAATGKAIASAIEKFETDFQNNFEKFYVEMSTQTFKAMRRNMPKTGQWMEWKSAVHQIGKEMTT